MTNDYDVIFVKEHPDDIIECLITDKFNRISPARAFYKKGDADIFLDHAMEQEYIFLLISLVYCLVYEREE